ncbi:MAG: ATP-binding protein [Candidatus Thorarchaeota archaeon]
MRAWEIMVRRLMIQIDEEKCTGCGLCITSCEEGALSIIDGKARVVSESFCDGLGACIGHCPEDALSLKEVETAEFNEEAAMQHVAKTREQHLENSCCPTVDLTNHEDSEDQIQRWSNAKSYLQNFPVKLKLIAPYHPALKNASLLISADCTGLAYPSLHENLLKGKTALQVCPKFEDYQSNLAKLTEIIRINEIKDITVLIMEVPCCSGLVRMTKQAAIAASKELPIKSLIVGVSGEVLSVAAV